MTVFIKHELEMFKKFLRKENTKYYGDVRDDLWSIKEATLDMALYFLKMMDHSDLADALQGKRSLDSSKQHLNFLKRGKYVTLHNTIPNFSTFLTV